MGKIKSPSKKVFTMDAYYCGIEFAQVDWNNTVNGGIAWHRHPGKSKSVNTVFADSHVDMFDWRVRDSNLYDSFFYLDKVGNSNL